MGRSQLSYGRRGRLSGADAGIRRVAPSFGKALYLTYSAKTNGLFAIESDAERLVANMLTLDPRVASFRPQPFKVDLLDQRILRTADAVAEARQKHKSREGAKFYTPDFEVVWLDRTRSILEVKVEGYEGDADSGLTLARVATILQGSGYQFKKVVIPANPRHALRGNISLLKRATAHLELWPSPERVITVEAFCGDQAVPMADLCKKLDISPNHVPVLLVCGAVSADVFANPIRGDLLLSAAWGDLGHLQMLEKVAV